MTKMSDWELPGAVRAKPEEVAFDLDAALASIVALRAEVPEDAFSASALGTEREGHGVVVCDGGVVLTIGYLVTEAEAVWLTTNRGVAVPAHVLAYDQPTGFGLVQALGRLDVPALARGNACASAVGDSVIMAGAGGRCHALSTRVVAKREFAGYWEYLLEEAIFTAPAHPRWGGAALIGMDGRLQAVGSLLVQGVTDDGEQIDLNMAVPIDLLEPIFDDLVRFGRARREPRPWLGVYATESKEGPLIVSLARGGPAHRAQLKRGDRLVAVAGRPIKGLADLYRRIWSLGPAGSEIPLTLMREGDRFDVRIGSADRNQFLKRPRFH